MFNTRRLIAVLAIGLGIAAATGCVRRETVREREVPVREREVVRERPVREVEVREVPRDRDRIEVEVERR